MKNKFLLLGATALLSTGALMANANTSEDLDLDVKVNIVVAESAQKINDIDFATIIMGGAGDALEVEMDPEEGSLKALFSGPSFLGNTQKGEVELTYANNNPQTISILPVQLTNENGDEITYTPSFAELTSQAMGTNYTKKTYGIGGTLTTNEAVEHGAFTGKITVTVIEDSEG